MSSNKGLKYIGNGAVPGIPARDLSEKEVTLYGGEELLLSYTPPVWTAYKASKPTSKKKVKDGN